MKKQKSKVQPGAAVRKGVAAKPPAATSVAIPCQKMSVLDAAQKVMTDEGRAMSAAEIMDIMLAKGYWATTGKTPANTLHAAIIRNITANPGHARFRRASQKGMFVLAAPVVAES